MECRAGILIGSTVVALAISGCSSGADKDNAGPTWKVGACVDSTDQRNINIVDCSDSSATAQIVGVFSSPTDPCESGGSRIEQTINGRTQGVGGYCAKSLSSITDEDRAAIDAQVNPKHFGLPVLGEASNINHGPDPAVDRCLTEPNVNRMLVTEDCGSGKAAWKVIAIVADSQACQSQATAAATLRIGGRTVDKMACLVAD